MLGKELRNARQAAGLSQEQLALKARVDRSYLSELERDLKSPTVALLLRLCSALGISAAALIAQVEKPLAKKPPSKRPLAVPRSSGSRRRRHRPHR